MAKSETPDNNLAPAAIRITPTKISPDLNTILGIILTFGLIAMAIIIGDSNANFFNIPSFLIVILGTLAVTSISYSWDELKLSLIHI